VQPSGEFLDRKRFTYPSQPLKKHELVGLMRHSVNKLRSDTMLL
jgi:hypothetical protein